jgi:hypothetical protein
MGDVIDVSGYQVIDHDDLMSFGKEAVAKMRADKARTTGD